MVTAQAEERDTRPTRPRKRRGGTVTPPRDVNQPGQWNRYHKIILELMDHVHGRLDEGGDNDHRFPNDTLFTEEQLSLLTPTHIYKFFAKKVFGREDPGVDDNPTEGRSSTLVYYKKALSYFMPNKLHKWTVVAGVGSGNPTKSQQVNDLISAVIKKETRALGQASKMDRPLTKDEFLQTLELMGNHGQILKRLRYLAMIKFQFHLIGRNDDTAHVGKDSLERSAEFPRFLTAKIKWSKNVREERDCPKQILLGAMDHQACVVLGLALYLEKWCKGGDGAASQWLFTEGVTDRRSPQKDVAKEVNKGKAAYSNFIKRHAFKNPVFIPERPPSEGKLGTHSIRKFGTTYARQCGCTRDEVDYRARWKSRRQQDRYTDTQLAWPDINVAAKLSFGGICYYKPLQGTGVTDEWLASSVAPAIANVFGNQVAAILGKALLWACFDPAMQASGLIPEDVKRDVVASWVQLNYSHPVGHRLDADVNPIKKVELTANEFSGQVHFDELADPDDLAGGGGAPGAAGGTAVGIRWTQLQWNHAMFSKLFATANEVNDIKNRQIASEAKFNQKLNKAIELSQRAAMAPVARRRPRPRALNSGASETGNAELGNAELCKCPHDLYVLWNEWEVGVGLNKPAKEFTAAERGRVKSKYCRRLKFWKCMERLIRAGCSSEVAVRRIYTVYGGPSKRVSYILKAMGPHEAHGGHTLLRGPAVGAAS